MSKSLVVFIIFFSLNSYSQELIERDIFTVYYSEEYEQPVWITYSVDTINFKCSNGYNIRPKFKNEENIQTSNDEDYNETWHKGHLAPAAHFDCSEEKFKKTFSFLNCALQHKNLNQGPWRGLETFERKLAEIYKVNVRVNLIFDDNSEKLVSGATVPSYFIKSIEFNNQKLNFKFPNDSTVRGKKWSYFIMSN